MFNYTPYLCYVGRNAVKNNFDDTLKLGKRCFIVTGRNSAVISGAFDDITGLLSANNVEYSVFDEVEANPLTTTCKRAGEAAYKFNADFVLGIGGGSVLDAAKAIAIFACNASMSHLDIYNRTIPAKHLPVVLVPTTAGTGSEVTGVSVLTNADTGIKKSISGADCYSVISYCDFYYTETMPYSVRVSTALDALAHAVEGYFSSSANEQVKEHTLRSLCFSKDYVLYKKFDKLTSDDFENLYMASLYGGYSINIAGTCFPHALSYYLTENFDVPHGKACAVFMPILFERAKKYCPEKYETVLNTLQCDIGDYLQCVIQLADVKINLTESEVSLIIKRWKDGVKNFDRSPGGFSLDDARNALLSLK